MKTSELIGDALNWAVARGECFTLDRSASGVYFSGSDIECKYSTEWAQGGPIIERERICIRDIGDGIWEADDQRDPSAHKYQGETPLIAAMRCYVASKLGASVDVPEQFSL
jgi:hypothetical protein